MQIEVDWDCRRRARLTDRQTRVQLHSPAAASFHLARQPSSSLAYLLFTCSLLYPGDLVAMATKQLDRLWAIKQTGWRASHVACAVHVLYTCRRQLPATAHRKLHAHAKTSNLLWTRTLFTTSLAKHDRPDCVSNGLIVYKSDDF